MSSKHLIKTSILLFSLLQLGVMVISPNLASIAQELPNNSITTIQLLATFPDIVIVITSLICGRLLSWISQKRLALLSCFLFVVVAIGGYLFHTDLVVLFLWSTLLGIAIGILMPVAIAMINQEFIGAQKTKLIGLQNTFVGLGAVILLIIGGMSSLIEWYYSYLAYLLILPALIFILFYIKNVRPEKPESSIRKKPTYALVLYYSIVVFIFFSLYNALPINISMLLVEKGISGNINATILVIALMLGSSLSGVLFNYLLVIFKHNTLKLGFILLLIGSLLIATTHQLYLMVIGMFVAGSSLSVVMAYATMTISKRENKQVVNGSIAIMLAASDCGGFFTSFYTNIYLNIYKTTSFSKILLMISLITLISLFILIIFDFKEFTTN